ncbi:MULTISPECIES: gluconokinase [Microbacterium]|uniref:Gluconokinase n=1 Tax=Microbacterium marmarense TaxID=3122051 RepID=A0ABU8LRT1_9MICO
MTGDALEHSPVVVVMGISAAGKSAVGAELARELDVDFVDGDDLHPAVNIARMSAGQALTDDDRGPWLNAVGARLAEAEGGTGVVVACSALRRRYRNRLRAAAPSAVFVHLSGSPALLAARAAARSDHFMPPTLLSSQIAALEALEADEAGVTIDVSGTVDDIVFAAADWLRMCGTTTELNPVGTKGGER